MVLCRWRPRSGGHVQHPSEWSAQARSQVLCGQCRRASTRLRTLDVTINAAGRTGGPRKDAGRWRRCRGDWMPSSWRRGRRACRWSISRRRSTGSGIGPDLSRRDGDRRSPTDFNGRRSGSGTLLTSIRSCPLSRLATNRWFCAHQDHQAGVQCRSLLQKQPIAFDMTGGYNEYVVRGHRGGAVATRAEPSCRSSSVGTTARETLDGLYCWKW